MENRLIIAVVQRDKAKSYYEIMERLVTWFYWYWERRN